MRRVLQQLKTNGIIETMRFSRRWLLYKSHYHLHDKKYEASEAVPTSRKVRAAQLDYGEDLRRHSVEYLAAPRLLVERAISLVPESVEKFNFVDIGSGLGRPLLVASKYGFQRVVGFELSPSLHDGAVANIHMLTAAKAKEVKSVLGNALEAEWPSGSTIFFLFNPFDAEFMRRFLNRISATHSTSYLLMLNFKHQALMADYRFQRVPLSFLEEMFWRIVSPYSIVVYRHSPQVTVQPQNPTNRLMFAAPVLSAWLADCLPAVTALCHHIQTH